MIGADGAGAAEDAPAYCSAADDDEEDEDDAGAAATRRATPAASRRNRSAASASAYCSASERGLGGVPAAVDEAAAYEAAV